MERSHRRRVVGGAVAAAAAVVAGCASMEPPRAQLATAETSIQQAVEAEAPQYAPLPLRVAREKVDAAKEAMRDGENERALRLAEEAAADAQLALAQARSARAQRELEEVQRSIETIREEAHRPAVGGVGR